MPTPTSPLPARKQMSFIIFSVGIVIAVLLGGLIVMGATQGPEKADPSAVMPEVRNIGLKYAVELTHAQYSRDVEAIDGTGRNRRFGDQRNWQVCIQEPRYNTASPGQPVFLYAVRTDETCTTLDKNYGYLAPVYDAPGRTGTHVVPDLTNYTPYMARQAFGDVASIFNTDPSATPSPTEPGLKNRVVKVIDKTGRAIFGGDGDYRICSQSPPAGTTWSGQVIQLTVVPYDDKC